MGVVFHYSFIFCSKNNSMYNKYTKCINKVDLSCNSEFTLKNKGAVLTTLLPLSYILT